MWTDNLNIPQKASQVPNLINRPKMRRLFVILLVRNVIADVPPQQWAGIVYACFMDDSNRGIYLAL